MVHGEFQNWVILYVDENKKQISKPFEDDEDGRLTPVGFVSIYKKIQPSVKPLN